MINALRNPGDAVENLAIGKIIEVDGTHIVAELDSHIAELTRVYNGVLYPIGQFGSIIKIHFGRRLIYAYVSRLRMKSEYDREHGVSPDTNASARVIEADLFGEGEWKRVSDKWELDFERGVSTFPLPQQTIYLTPRNELADVFGRGSDDSIVVGEHVGAGATPCYLDMNELLGKHTAVLGSTGAGKSSAVAALLHAIKDHGKNRGFPAWSPRIIILDPHNEYGTAFPSHTRLSTDEETLLLPYWMLDFEETISLIIGKTEHAATSQTNVLKTALLEVRREGARALGINPDQVTVDSPVPYELGDSSGLDYFGKKGGLLYSDGLIGKINTQRPNNANRADHLEYHKLIRKLEVLFSDTRLRFMMAPWDSQSKSDPLPEVLKQFLGDGDSVCIVDLSGIPNEVAGAASSAVARTLFAAKLWQTTDEREKNPILLVCEEAHRYVPDKGEAQYAAAREAIQRLAKEGRKYGIGLMLVSQRPSEVDATVLSQCNSWVVLRITNDADREHVRAILPDSLIGLTKILSGLRQREAIVVGQATSLPSRIRIRKLEESQLPRSHDISFVEGWKAAHPNGERLTELASRWRFQSRSSAGGASQAAQAENGQPNSDAPPF